MMTGTPLLGAKYFQEIASLQNAVDRGEIVEMGSAWPPEEDLYEGAEPYFTGCINVFDTNPAEGACGDDHPKIYCPGVGLVQDQDLELVWYGSVGCDDYDDEDDNDDHDKRKRWGWRNYHRHF